MIFFNTTYQLWKTLTCELSLIKSILNIKMVLVWNTKVIIAYK